MTETISKHERNVSAILHASTLSRFFIPFGNFLLPLVFWLANKKELPFVDYHGKQALNFQLSMFLYSALLGMVSIPFFIGLLPAVLEGGLLGFNPLHEVNTLDFEFNGLFRNGLFLWPLGIGGLLYAGLFVVNIVYTILATLRTHEGEYFKYPLTIRFIK